MRTPGDAEFIALWESGFRRHPLDRALLLLSAAFPEMSYADLADWPIGRRNQALIGLYDRCFGSRLQLETACGSCGEKLELELDARGLAGETQNQSAEPQVDVNGLAFRLPSSRDLARIVGETDPAAGAVRLLDGCFVGATPPARWSEEDLSAVGDRLALADPLAEIRLTLHCPSCEIDWEEALDPVSFFWTSLESRARQILSEIHTLASAYGWSEADILSMSESRRAIYLELAQS
jgi:hypothetical protein